MQKTKSVKIAPKISSQMLYHIGVTTNQWGDSIHTPFFPCFTTKKECTCNQICEYNCKIHWSIWSKKRYFELEKYIDPQQNWYFARLDYNLIYDTEKVSDFFLKVIKAVEYKIGRLRYVWVNHIDSAPYIHRHYLISSPSDMVESTITQIYSKYAKKFFGIYAPHDMSVKKEIHVFIKLRYMLGIGGVRHEYNTCPWRDYRAECSIPPNVCDGNLVYRGKRK